MNTTLNKIRAHSPCKDGWEKLLNHLGKTQADDEALPMLAILESNELRDAVWCLRSLDGCEREIKLFALDVAETVRHIMTDPRSTNALDIARRHLAGEVSAGHLRDAAIRHAAYAAYAAYAAADAAIRDAQIEIFKKYFG